jgi:hypothetical protein
VIIEYIFQTFCRDYWQFARSQPQGKDLWAEDIADLDNSDLGYKCAIALLEGCDVLHKVWCLLSPCDKRHSCYSSNLMDVCLWQAVQVL